MKAGASERVGALHAKVHSIGARHQIILKVTGISRRYSGVGQNRVQRTEAVVTSSPLIGCHVGQWRKEDTGAQRYSFVYTTFLSEMGNAPFSVPVLAKNCLQLSVT